MYIHIRYVVMRRSEVTSGWGDPRRVPLWPMFNGEHVSKKGVMSTFVLYLTIDA